MDRQAGSQSILSAADAQEATGRGADGIIVSNHGGRALDQAPATLHVLPEIVDAAGNTSVDMLDGGIRRASDVVKAISLGAKAVLIGRPGMFALSYGEAAVTQLLEFCGATWFGRCRQWDATASGASIDPV